MKRRSFMNFKYRSVLALGMSVAMMVQAPVVAFANEGEPIESTPESQTIVSTNPESQSTASTDPVITADAEAKKNGFEVYGMEGTNKINSTCGSGYLTYQGTAPSDSNSPTIDGESDFAFNTPTQLQIIFRLLFLMKKTVMKSRLHIK